MNNTMPIDVVVSRGGGPGGFQCVFAEGPGVQPPDRITVTGSQPVTLEFNAVAGNGVQAVSFLDDAKQSILVGEVDNPECPPTRAGNEFEEGKPGNSKNKLNVKDRKTRNGQYKFQLTFLVTPQGGAPQQHDWDPVIINQ